MFRTFTERQLVTNVFIGFAICFPCAYVVLLVATQNVALASIAIVAVIGIVASVLGFCHWGKHTHPPPTHRNLMPRDVPERDCL